MEEQINVECNVTCAESGDFIARNFLDEDLVVSVGGDKISGTTTPAISHHWGNKVPRQHYDKQGIVPWDLYYSVYWDGVEKVMKKISEMFSVWVIKQVSGFCGTNHMLNVIYGNMVDICPNCGYSPKKSTHIPCCRDDGRTTMFHKSAEGLVSWMEQQQTDGELVLLIRSYLLSRGRRSMLSLCHPNSPYSQLASLHNELSYGNFLEGKICILYHSMQQLNIEKWHL